MRGYSITEAFTGTSPAIINAQPPTAADNGFRLQIDSEFSRSLIERTDQQGDVAYGMRHTPGAHVKLYNASKNPDASIALSFQPAPESSAYDDIFKIVKRPNGGYELHLQKIQTVVIDGKRIDTSTLSKFL